jgi:hypothetical protein
MYPRVKLNTTYSFGIDDQEFVVAFETNFPEDFLDLVQQLRETEISVYTLKDTPIFSCVRLKPAEMLDRLGKRVPQRLKAFVTTMASRALNRAPVVLSQRTNGKNRFPSGMTNNDKNNARAAGILRFAKTRDGWQMARHRRRRG